MARAPSAPKTRLAELVLERAEQLNLGRQDLYVALAEAIGSTNPGFGGFVWAILNGQRPMPADHLDAYAKVLRWPKTAAAFKEFQGEVDKLRAQTATSDRGGAGGRLVKKLAALEAENLRLAAINRDQESEIIRLRALLSGSSSGKRHH